MNMHFMLEAIFIKKNFLETIILTQVQDATFYLENRCDSAPYQYHCRFHWCFRDRGNGLRCMTNVFHSNAHVAV